MTKHKGVFTIHGGDVKASSISTPNDNESSPSSTSGGCVNYFSNMARSIQRSLGDTKLVVHILVCMFAIASWVDLNGTWSELPLLVIEAAEGWNLPSYITIISQVANIGPILFVLISVTAPWTKPCLEKVTSFIIIIISMVASILIAFFWNRHSYIGGADHSTALLTLNFFLAIGDCTSSLSFYAFMSLMKPQYMASLFIGEGLSGMLPAMIALGQGVSDIDCVTKQVNETYPNGTEYNKTITYPVFGEPGFSVRVYFLILAGIIFCSGVSFLLLNFWSYCQSEMVCEQGDGSDNSSGSSKEKSYTSYGTVNEDDETAVITSNSQKSKKAEKYMKDHGHIGPYSGTDDEAGDIVISQEGAGSRDEIVVDSSQSLGGKIKRYLKLGTLPLWKFFLLLIILVVINMTLTTFLPTIQTYTVLPYGLDYYHLTTTLTQIANPTACFFALFIMAEQISVVLMVTFLGQVGVAYLIYLAAMSPEPPLHDSTRGGELTVAIWILVTLLLVYGKVCVAGILRKHGRSSLICCGVATQIGALIGAITGFILVNENKLFKDAPYC